MKKRQPTNGRLAVELFSGECFFQARQQAKTEQVADYFSALATDLQYQGYEKAPFFLGGVQRP